MRSADVEVVVVGAGVMGAATARALARAGRDTLLVEQFEPGHERGSSHGSSRIVRLSYPAVEWVRLAQESYPLWRELEAESGTSLLELHGTLDLGDWEPNRDALTACGVDSEVLDAAEVERRFGVQLEAGERGLYQADGGIAYADRALEAFLGGAIALGAAVRVQSRARDRGGRGRRDVGGVRAGRVVVTAGAWAPKLFELSTRPDPRDGRPTSRPPPDPVRDRHGRARRLRLRVSRPGCG